MRILMVLPELAPFYKYSRLGLGYNLHNLIFNLNSETSIIMPFYDQMRTIKCRKIETYDDLSLTLYQGNIPGTDKVIFFLKPGDHFFDPFYGNHVDIEQVLHFSRGVARFVQNHPFDVVHSHHWQGGLVPLLIRNLELHVRTVYTFYDLDQQGPIEPGDLESFKLSEKHLNEIDKLGNLSLVKLGIIFADDVTTTSRHYTHEVQEQEFGHELDPYFLQISNKLFGINNGVRYGEWNPAKDDHLLIHYKDLAGKREVKKNLQKELGLEVGEKIPLILYGGRLTSENGCALVLDALPDILQLSVQVLVYGTGDTDFQIQLKEMAAEYYNLKVVVGYNNDDEHRYFAASDMILLPSREAPGSTLHLRAMRYGTIPIARRTGAFVDVIKDTSSRDPKGANGFLFSSYYSNSLIQIVEEALDVFHESSLWEQYVKNAMAEDWSWKYSAKQYEELYQRFGS